MPRLFETKVQLEVPFHDVDGLHVVWHGHYLKYFEIARTAMLRQMGYDVMEMKDSGLVWPVIDAHCRYVKPLVYGQAFVVHCWIEEYEHRLLVRYEVRDLATGQRLAKGSTTQAAVDMHTGQITSTDQLKTKLGLP